MNEDSAPGETTSVVILGPAVHGGASSPGEARDAMMLFMRAGKISARVRGVFDTIVFHTCSAAERTV